MWVIKLSDGGYYGLYLRDRIFDGRILCFQYEEEGLRLIMRIKRVVEPAFDVKLLCVRFEGDQNREEFQRVSKLNIPELAAFICDMCK